MLVNTKHIGLVNLIAQKRIVPELLQDQSTEQNIKSALSDILMANKYASILDEYAKITEDLGDGHTSEKVAHHIYKELSRVAAT